MSRQMSAKQIITFGFVILALGLALHSPGFLTQIQASTLGVVLLTLVLWGAGDMPNYVPALIFFAGMLIFKLAPTELVFSGFGSAAVWLVISGFVIGSAIKLSGLGDRLAKVVSPVLSSSYPRLIGGLMLLSMLLGFLMPSSIGRSVALVPIGCNMPSFAILPSNIPNMILTGSAETIYGSHFSYWDCLDAQQVLHSTCELGPSLGVAAVDSDALDRPDSAGGGDVGFCLESGSDNSESPGVLPGQIFHAQSRRRADAKALQESVRAHQQRLTRIDAEEHDEACILVAWRCREPDLVLHSVCFAIAHAIRIDPDRRDAQLLDSARHGAQPVVFLHLIGVWAVVGRDEVDQRRVDCATGPMFEIGLVEHFEAVVDCQNLADFLIGQKKRHTSTSPTTSS